MRCRPWPWMAALILAFALISLAGTARAVELSYVVTIVGVEENDLRETLEEVSQLVTLQARPPATLTGLGRRIEADRQELQRVLESEGYYAGTVDIRLNADVSPARVTITVEPGPPFTLAEYNVHLTGDGAHVVGLVPPLDELGVEVGTRARAAIVVEAEQRLVELVSQVNFPFARVADRQAVVDFDTSTMHVDVVLDTGPAARFGPVTISGLETVEEVFVRRRIPWQPGEPFDLRELERFRRALAEGGLFSVVRIDYPQEVAPDGLLPVTVEVTEAPHRYIGGGVNYSTAEGAGLRLFWGHLNLLGQGEQLDIQGTLGQTRSGASITFRKPDFLATNQRLLLEALTEIEDTDAYDSRSVRASAGIERNLTDTTVAAAGVDVEQSFVKRPGEERESFTLLSVPLNLRRDTTDSVLNPTMGTRLIFNVAPTVDLAETGRNFLTLRGTGSGYWGFFEGDRVVLAGRMSLGSILGAGTASIPPTRRFYAGGGASIRGYGYQLVGPLDELNRPIGGRSLVEVGGEVRVRVTETIGIVPFIEGGNVYEEATPDFGEGLRWGAGLGFRYYTGFGPVRLDVAVPLDRRRGVDDPFQFYISLGQAF